MRGLSESDAQWLAPEAVLLRRAGPGRIDRAGRVKPGAFVLRVARNEQSLSFYTGDAFDPEELLDGAPGEGWGVLSVPVGHLRRLGFMVVFDPDVHDARFGAFHVSATPPEYDADGQIPLALRAALAAGATVVKAPAS